MTAQAAQTARNAVIVGMGRTGLSVARHLQRPADAVDHRSVDAENLFQLFDAIAKALQLGSHVYLPAPTSGKRDAVLSKSCSPPDTTVAAVTLWPMAFS